MTAWQRLGIEPTDNQREIKKAYAKLMCAEKTGGFNLVN